MFLFKKRIIIPAAILVLAALAFFRPQVETRPVEIPLKKVETMDIKKAPTEMRIRSQGTVTPGIQSNLVAQVAGRIVGKSDNFDAGGYFNKGETLVSIDASDYKLAVVQAKSQVAQAELALQLEEQQAKIAREEWAALNSEPISPLVAREPQLAQAKAARDAAKASLERAQLDLSRTSVRAPFTGRMRATATDVGAFVSPGTPLGTVYSVDVAEVRLPISDDALAFLTLPANASARSKVKGPQVVLKAPFAGELREWTGNIVRMEGEIDARSRMIYVVAEIKDPLNRANKPGVSQLLPGLFVEAEIIGNSVENLVRIPRAAVRNDSQVLVVDNENKIRFRDVQILRESGDLAYVGKGINDGERICITPLSIVTEGMEVEVVEPRDLTAQEVINE